MRSCPLIHNIKLEIEFLPVVYQQLEAAKDKTEHIMNHIYESDGVLDLSDIRAMLEKYGPQSNPN